MVWYGAVAIRVRTRLAGNAVNFDVVINEPVMHHLGALVLSNS